MTKTILALTLLMLCARISIYATIPNCIQQLREVNKISKPDFQILFLKGGDCINCYKAGKIALKNKTINPDVIFVKDVAKREMDDFLEQEMEIKNNILPVIRNDSLWDCLNRYGTSAVANISGNRMIKITETKALFVTPPSESLLPQYNFRSPDDSFDITRYYGSIKSTVTPIDDDYIIYNDTKNQLTTYSTSTKKKTASFEVNKLPYFKLDSLKSLFPINKRVSVENTISQTSPTNPMLNGSFWIKAPYVMDHKVIVPIHTYVVDTALYQNKKELAAYTYIFLGTYSKDFSAHSLRLYDYTIQEGNLEFGNSFSYGSVISKCLFNMKVGVTGRRDSIFAQFDFCSKDKTHPTHFLNVRYPDSFPIINKSGINRSYITKFVTINNQDFYYFCLENTLHSLNGNINIRLSHIEPNIITEDVQNSFVSDMYVSNDMLYVLYCSDKYTTLKLNKYRTRDMSYVSTSLISNGRFESSFIQDDKVVAIYSDDERVTIYRYKYR
jgi:hypothetical protein